MIVCEFKCCYSKILNPETWQAHHIRVSTPSERRAFACLCSPWQSCKRSCDNGPHVASCSSHYRRFFVFVKIPPLYFESSFRDDSSHDNTILHFSNFELRPGQSEPWLETVEAILEFDAKLDPERPEYHRVYVKWSFQGL